MCLPPPMDHTLTHALRRLFPAYFRDYWDSSSYASFFKLRWLDRKNWWSRRTAGASGARISAIIWSGS